MSALGSVREAPWHSSIRSWIPSQVRAEVRLLMRDRNLDLLMSWLFTMVPYHWSRGYRTGSFPSMRSMLWRSICSVFGNNNLNIYFCFSVCICVCTWAQLTCEGQRTPHKSSLFLPCGVWVSNLALPHCAILLALTLIFSAYYMAKIPYISSSYFFFFGIGFHHKTTGSPRTGVFNLLIFIFTAQLLPLRPLKTSSIS